MLRFISILVKGIILAYSNKRYFSDTDASCMIIIPCYTVNYVNGNFGIEIVLKITLLISMQVALSIRIERYFLLFRYAIFRYIT